MAHPTHLPKPGWMQQTQVDTPEWPITFLGWWEDGDREDPDTPEPWETFTVMVYGKEAGDMRELLPADLPALLEVLGARQEGE